ncbi:MAG: cupredoxin domain-containing protein [Solirubrobacteraceae bacterium]
MRRTAVFLVLLVAALAACSPQAAAAKPRVQPLKFRFGPISIAPGQNTISFDGENVPRPRVPGWIVGFRPNLERTNGSVPGVDVIHLHHAVWLINGNPTFAAGEEKSRIRLPRGFGWRFKRSDQWVLNHMIHNLLPDRDRVYLTYEIDFIPASSPLAKGIREVQTRWLDVENGNAYPVFDVHRGSGHDGRFTYPNDAPGAYGGGPQRNRWNVDRDGVLVQSVGHLHPGGLYTDIVLERNGRRVNLFRSRAHYWEPAGAVSWDVAMTATPSDWRVAVRRGDVVTVSATYDSKRGSWYESMGIMPVAFAAGARGGLDPFSGKLNRRGRITHGHLPENDNHGGEPGGLPDARRLAAGPTPTGPVAINGFLYGLGDLQADSTSRPPLVRAGQPLAFVNRDAARTIFHTITSCRAPCNRTTGIAYPLADGPVEFDSGELGFGPAGFTPAANRDTWSTPANLTPGTYNYFCRVHPFMRGAFRVAR